MQDNRLHNRKKGILILLLAAALILSRGRADSDTAHQRRSLASPSLTSSEVIIDEQHPLLPDAGITAAEAVALSKIDQSHALRQCRQLFALLFAMPAVSVFFFTSACAYQFFVRSDCTPRYSVVTYLHRSDGKKSAAPLIF